MKFSDLGTDNLKDSSTFKKIQYFSKSNPQKLYSSSEEFNLKYKKYALYFLICFLFGILFVVFVSLFSSANYAFLDDLFNPNYWDFGSESNNLKLFLFGFIIAYIILLIKKSYKGID